jgi:CDP-diacylglycerol--glycerol-3-phosphate 3-phosphatidyltransferase
MPRLDMSTLPNVITVARIVLCPVVFGLLFVPTFTARFIAWLLFLIAAFSDLWDGYLARKYSWISDFGKLVDPIADKLLLVATFIPFYVLSQRATPATQFPLVGGLPLWIVVVIFGRELLVTIIRSVAAGRGLVIPAGREGKLKAVFQNIFIGTAIAWMALRTAAETRSWQSSFWDFWQAFHGFVFITSLVIAIVLTVYSLLVYLQQWRRLIRSRT